MVRCQVHQTTFKMNAFLKYCSSKNIQVQSIWRKRSKYMRILCSFISLCLSISIVSMAVTILFKPSIQIEMHQTWAPTEGLRLQVIQLEVIAQVRQELRHKRVTVNRIVLPIRTIICIFKFLKQKIWGHKHRHWQVHLA